MEIIILKLILLFTLTYLLGYVRGLEELDKAKQHKRKMEEILK